MHVCVCVCVCVCMCVCVCVCVCVCCVCVCVLCGPKKGVAAVMIGDRGEEVSDMFLVSVALSEGPSFLTVYLAILLPFCVLHARTYMHRGHATWEWAITVLVLEGGALNNGNHIVANLSRHKNGTT